MSAIKNHYHDQICSFEPGPDPEDLPGWPGFDRYDNQHMPILAREAAVMRATGWRSRRVPIGISLPIACFISWGVLAAIVFAVIAAVSHPLLALSLVTLAAGVVMAGRTLRRRK